MPTETDLAYCAGLIDGEGYIGIIKEKSYRCKHKFCYRAKLQIQMKNQKTIRFVAKVLKLKIFEFHPKQFDCLMYHATAPRLCLEKILLELLPYLQGKRKQAEVVLEFLQLQKDWRKNWHGNKGFTNEFLRKYEDYHRRLKILNKKSSRIKENLKNE